MGKKQGILIAISFLIIGLIINGLIVFIAKNNANNDADVVDTDSIQEQENSKYYGLTEQENSKYYGLTEQENSKYYGLTEQEITNVKLIEDSCDRSAAQAYFTAGEAMASIVEEKCQNTIIETIERYRNN